MISFSLSELAGPLNGKVLGEDASFMSISTDTRTLRQGDCFIALVGPNFDGHDYLSQAEQKGASAAMVSKDAQTHLSCIRVADTRIGLGQLANCWRSKTNARVVALTGSNGKTTLKEMIASILESQGDVLATRGNLNNDIGVPLTLSELQEQDFAVVEMGANHPGEIRYLTNIAQPDIAVLNNAGRAHLEGFGSLEGVARAKAEIIEGLNDDGVFVFNADDHYSELWREISRHHKQLTFGFDTSADIQGLDHSREMLWDESGFLNQFSVKTPGDEFIVQLKLAGVHNQMNALAAIAVAYVLGVDQKDIAAGLSRLRPVKGRLSAVRGIQGSRLIDDTYNANPDSVLAAINVLKTAPGRKTLLLGDLAELGENAEPVLELMGKEARKAGIERLWLCGQQHGAAKGFGEDARVFEQQPDLIDAVKEDISESDVLLIKGSRAAGMERVVEALKAGEAAC